MSDEIKYKLNCNHVTRGIKDFGQCPNCDMHTLLNLHEITMKKLDQANNKLEKAITFIDGCIEKVYDLPPEKGMFNSIKHKESRVSLQARQTLKELKEGE